MANEPTIYQKAHLTVATIRILAHRTSIDPTAEDVAEFLDAHIEDTLFTLHKLADRGIVRMVPSAFKDVIHLENHLAIEEFAAEGEGPTVSEKYQETEEAKEEKVSEISERFSPKFEDQRKKDLFADLQDKLKTGGKSAQPNPLDELTKKK